MTDQMNAVKVTVDNWDDAPKAPKPFIADKTTLRTYVISGAAPTPGNTAWIQISDYEINRVRMVIQVYDADVALCTDPPRVSPDTDAVGTAPQGRLLASSLNLEYVLYGKDAFYINPVVAGNARVTVTKEYC